MPALFSNLTAEKARTYGLVLEASNVRYQTRPHGRCWSIEVSATDRTAACRAISKYLDENPSYLIQGGKESTLPPGQKSYSAIYAITPLILIHWAAGSVDEYRVLVASFGAETGLILQGDLYRCITAMLLHVDWAHLLGNVVALAVFGTALAYTAGWGVAWLLIVLSAAGGNLLAALCYGPGHLSVGASTAVFAAVGLCAARSFWRGYYVQSWTWKIWTPLAGGLAILGMLGAAAKTDLVAHMMGFVAGLVLGLLWGWRMEMAKWPTQVIAALLTAGLVVGSWFLGLGYSG